jgi:hypothetical protein
MSRLSIEIEPEQHRQIKTLATFAGMSIKDFILMKTLAPKEDQNATEALLRSPANAKRLREAVEVSSGNHIGFDSLEDLQDALGM